MQPPGPAKLLRIDPWPLSPLFSYSIVYAEQRPELPYKQNVFAIYPEPLVSSAKDYQQPPPPPPLRLPEDFCYFLSNSFSWLAMGNLLFVI